MQVPSLHEAGDGPEGSGAVPGREGGDGVEEGGHLGGQVEGGRGGFHLCKHPVVGGLVVVYTIGGFDVQETCA